MKELCGRSLNLGFARHPVGRLEYNGHTSNVTASENDGACSVTIESGLSKDSIAFHFKDIVLPKGACLFLHQRAPKTGVTYSVKGMSTEFCSTEVPPIGVELRTKPGKDLMVKLVGTSDKDARMDLMFTLYNEKDVKSTCNSYSCEENGRCEPQQECLYAYTPCDFYRCSDSTADPDRRLSHLQIYGIVFGILIGLSMCMCRFAVKSSDIKEDILNRVHSYHRNGGHGSRVEEPDCHDANRYQAVVMEDITQNNRPSRRNSSEMELRRSPSGLIIDQVTTDHDTYRIVTRQNESFSAIVECNFHYSESSPRCSRHCSRSASRTTSRHASRDNSRQGSRSGSRQASRSGSRQASLSGSRHTSRNGSPIHRSTFSAPNILPHAASHPDYSEHYSPTLKRALYNAVYSDLPPPFSSVVVDDPISGPCNYSVRERATDPSSLPNLQNSCLDSPQRRRARDIDIPNGSLESIPLRSMSFDDVTSPVCPPPSYEDVIAHEDKYNIKPA